MLRVCTHLECRVFDRVARRQNKANEQVATQADTGRPENSVSSYLDQYHSPEHGHNKREHECRGVVQPLGVELEECQDDREARRSLSDGDVSGHPQRRPVVRKRHAQLQRHEERDARQAELRRRVAGPLRHGDDQGRGDTPGADALQHRAVPVYGVPERRQ